MTLQRNHGQVKRFAWLMKLAVWLQALPMRMTPAPFRLMQISTAFWQSRVLYVAARLDLATLLADAERPVQALAEQLAVQPDACYRLLRMLVAMGVFTETRPGVFANNTVSNALREDKAHNIRALILMHNSPQMSRPWYEQLEAGLRNGQPPFQLTHGQPLFTYMDEHAEFDALFGLAMERVEVLLGDSFVTDFDWGRFQRVLDIGGSRGGKAVAILKRHPQLKALVFDRVQLIKNAPAYWAERVTPELLARLAFQAGDARETIPHARNDQDIYLLSAVLHGLNDVECGKVLANILHASGSTGARVALLELVLPEQGADLPSASFDMQMFMGTQGRERTLAQWRHLFAQTGWRLEEIIGLQSLAKILVLAPA